MKILAFIPARGGSIGIPRKNLYPIAGKPLIYYTIEIAKSLGENVIPFLSTDDSEIKEYGKSLGLMDDYIRPADLATDTSSTLDTVLHGLDWFSSNSSVKIDAVLLLQPTSPIRLLSEIKSAIVLFEEKRLATLVSVTVMREHPYECIKSQGDSWSYIQKADSSVTRRQDYKEKFYFLDGSFYLSTVDFIKNHKSFIAEGKTFLFESSLRYSIDIDELEDMYLAESLIKRNSIK
jgi:CMP-N,N'-diacetyllegionaminic acid synthase